MIVLPASLRHRQPRAASRAVALRASSRGTRPFGGSTISEARGSPLTTRDTVARIDPEVVVTANLAGRAGGAVATFGGRGPVRVAVLGQPLDAIGEALLPLRGLLLSS